jgi:Uma2 family endonuclease
MEEAMIATSAPTVKEWIAEHGERCEYFLGAIEEKPLPNRDHSKAQSKLTSALSEYGERTGRGEAYPEWHHRFGAANDIRVYVPDLVFVLAPNHLNLPEYANRASDIMIEIASPDQGAELADKVEFYLHNGARRVWLIDPQRRRVGVYSPDASPRSIAGADGVLTDDLLPGFALPLADLFGANT